MGLSIHLGEGGFEDPGEYLADFDAAEIHWFQKNGLLSEGLEVKEGKGSIDDNVGIYALQTEFAGLGVLSFKRRIRYFSDGVMLGSKLFCEEKFREFRSYFQTDRDRTGKLIKGKHKKKRRAAPEGHLLHLHSVRAFVKVER